MPSCDNCGLVTVAPDKANGGQTPGTYTHFRGVVMQFAIFSGLAGWFRSVGGQAQGVSPARGKRARSMTRTRVSKARADRSAVERLEERQTVTDVAGLQAAATGVWAGWGGGAKFGWTGQC